MRSANPPMERLELPLVTYLARDYDEAIDWFSDVLGFVLLEDTDQGGGKRWVRMAPSRDATTAFLIARAVGSQVAAVGEAAGGRVSYFLRTNDFVATFQRLKRCHVKFEEEPRHEAYGDVAVFHDLYGNRWDLLGPSPD